MLGISFFTVFFEFLTDTTVPIAILRYRQTEKTQLEIARKIVKITIRAVDTDLKGLSMGMFWLVVKLFGSLPSPVLLGGFLDWACLGNGFSYSFIDSRFLHNFCISSFLSFRNNSSQFGRRAVVGEVFAGFTVMIWCSRDTYPSVSTSLIGCILHDSLTG